MSLVCKPIEVSLIDGLSLCSVMASTSTIGLIMREKRRLSGVRSCTMPGLPTYLEQESNAGSVHCKYILTRDLNAN